MSEPEVKNTTNRFDDAEREPCVMLTPIEGFSQKPLVTLEEATEPLRNIVPRLSTYVCAAKQCARNPANNLTIDESASIALYTMEWTSYTDSLYYILNNTLRTENRQALKPWFLYIKLFVTALCRLPSVSLTGYRGLRNDINGQNDKYQIGNEFIWWGFSSCSKNRNNSKDLKVLFIINCINAKDISKHSYFRDDEEILLLPSAMFKVINNQYDTNGLHIIHLQEIKPPFTFFEEEEEEIIRTYVNPELEEYINRCKPNSEVFLIGKRFNENDIEIIVQQLIINKQCRRLFMRESNVTSQGAVAIADSLYNTNTLEHLVLSHNTIGDQGTKALAEALSRNNNTTLRQLCLNHNGITDEGIEYLANMLESNQTLTHLWLSGNRITSHGLKRLAQVLANNNRSLQVLELESIAFHDDGDIHFLLDMLNKNQSLTQVNLRKNKLSRSTRKQLKRVAKTKTNFQLNIDRHLFF